MIFTVEIFTDGACRGNPGPGGWGALLRYQSHEKELYGFETQTTNNRMELIAPIMALQSLKNSCNVILMTDSQYVQKGITQWIFAWKKNNWMTAASKKTPVKNSDLWQKLDLVANQHKVQWQWIRGHRGHIDNERVDRLANRAIDEALMKTRKY